MKSAVLGLLLMLIALGHSQQEINQQEVQGYLAKSSRKIKINYFNLFSELYLILYLILGVIQYISIALYIFYYIKYVISF